MVMNEKKNKKRFTIGMIVFFLMLSIGGVGAKYVYQFVSKNLLSAKTFYFESNLLKTKEENYILNPTATSITFTISNNIDELRYADDDITYNVKVNDQYLVEDGKLENGGVSVDSLTIDNLEKGKVYKVVAAGRAGYVKYLRASFTVSDTDRNLYKYLEQKDGYVLLTVWTENLAGDITIKMPAGLVPDGSDTTLRDVYNYSEGKYIATEFVDDTNFGQTYSSYTYRFFVDGISNVTVNDFVVSHKTNEATTIAGVGKLK